MATFWSLPAWTWPALAALLGSVAAWWLRRRGYRRPDDPAGGGPSPWLVPVLAVLGTLVAGPFWRAEPAPVLLTYTAALVWGLVLAVIDLEVQRLPDRLVLTAYPVVGVLLLIDSVVEGDLTALLRALASAGAAVGFFLVAALLAPSADGLGLGDVKLSGVLAGLLGWYGWYTALVGLAAGFVLIGLVSLVLLVLRRVNRRSSVPFGPAMIGGAYLAALVAPAL